MFIPSPGKRVVMQIRTVLPHSFATIAGTVQNHMKAQQSSNPLQRRLCNRQL